MKFSTASVIVAGSSLVAAQGVPTNTLLGASSPEQIAKYALGLLTPSCQSTLKGFFQSNSTQYQCLHIDSLLPAIMTNASIVPYVDQYVSDICYSQPCSNATLQSTAKAIVEGCSKDLAMVHVSNMTVYEVVDLYPLAREVACLKTKNPMAPANASIPVNSTAYNSTNGTFCVTELMTDLSAYLGANLTNSYIDTLALGGNATALELLQKIPKTAVCKECIFAAADLIEESIPELGNLTVGNTTINGFLNSTCPAYNVTMNGTLPTNITEAAVNSTYTYKVVAGNVTLLPSTASSTASGSSSASASTNTSKA